MRVFKRFISIILGFAALCLIFIQSILILNQPYTSSGISFSFQKNSIQIEKLNQSSPAGKAGIKKGDTFIEFNNTPVENWIQFSNGVSFSTSLQFTTNFFKYGKNYSFKKSDGNIYSFTLTKQPLIERIKNISQTLLITFLLSVLCIASGIISSFAQGDRKTIRRLIAFLYCLGIAVFNAFSCIWNSIALVHLSSILFDAAGLFGISFLLAYINHSFETSHLYPVYSKVINICKTIPPVIFVIKYAIILFAGLPLTGSNLEYLAHAAILVFTIALILCTAFILVKYPRQITLLYRFIFTGFVYSILPSVFVMITNLIFRQTYFTQLQSIMSLAPFSFIPVILLLSIVESRGHDIHRVLKGTITWLGYISLSSIILYILYSSAKNGISTVSTLTFFFLSPLFFKLLDKPLSKQLNYSVLTLQKAQEEFEESITDINSFSELYQLTNNALEKQLSCSFVFIQIITADSGSTIPFVNTRDIEIDTIGNLIRESNSYKQNKSIHYLSKDCFAIPFYKNKKLDCRLFIGSKKSGDKYYPGEITIATKIADIFYQHFLLLNNRIVTQKLHEKDEQIIAMQTNTIYSMANLIESRDGGTGKHVKRTGAYSEMIAKKAMEKGYYPDELTPHYIDLLSKAAPMHDIGKIVVPDSVLKKPGKLTAEEFELMQKHTTEGGKIINDVLSNSEDEEYIKIATEVATSHHEKWNGAGYPNHLKEENIPLSARIMAIADVFDALVSPRCYKEPFPVDEAFDIIEKESGSHFDPVLAKVFLSMKEKAIAVMNEFKD